MIPHVLFEKKNISVTLTSKKLTNQHHHGTSHTLRQNLEKPSEGAPPDSLQDLAEKGFQEVPGSNGR